VNVFYDNLVNIHELHLEFDQLDVPLKERKELISLADSTMHHEVFDLIMVEIPEEHRTYFLEIFSADPGDTKILEFLKEKVPGIEGKIKKRGQAVKDKFVKEMKKHR
jgi:hypothetical protein